MMKQNRTRKENSEVHAAVALTNLFTVTKENADAKPRSRSSKTKEASRSSEQGKQEYDAKIFPQRLFEVLSDERNASAIRWLDHGRGFIITDRNKFASDVLPRCFKATKYASFTRKMNRWNFKRVARGPEMGAYYHEYFQRGKPNLCIQMYCKNERAKFATAVGQSDSSVIQPLPLRSLQQPVQQQFAAAPVAALPSALAPPAERLNMTIPQQNMTAPQQNNMGMPQQNNMGMPQQNNMGMPHQNKMPMPQQNNMLLQASQALKLQPTMRFPMHTTTSAVVDAALRALQRSNTMEAGNNVKPTDQKTTPTVALYPNTLAPVPQKLRLTKCRARAA